MELLLGFAIAALIAITGVGAGSLIAPLLILFLHVPVAEMNEAVLSAVEEHALTPAAIEQVIQLTERDDAQEQHAAPDSLMHG